MLHLEVEKIVTFALESESHILSQSVILQNKKKINLFLIEGP